MRAFPGLIDSFHQDPLHWENQLTKEFAKILC